VTVTQTITVPAGGAPTELAGLDGVTTTVQPGSTAVIPGTGATHPVGCREAVPGTETFIANGE
jgi:hypothetical protein